MRLRPLHVAVALLASLGLLSVVACLSFAGWSYWQIYGIGGWRDELYGQVGMTATTRAMRDYREGHLRLYTLDGENDKPKYTGTNDGPFEVWIPQFYPSLGRAHRYAKEQFVAFYNRKMKYMYSHPDKFPRNAEDVQPDGAANGSQPIRSETNRTSSAAGSRR